VTEPTLLPTRRPPPPAREDDTLEDDIRHMIRKQPVSHPVVMPKLDELAKMAGEATLANFEVAAKAVEEMLDVAKLAVEKLGGAIIQCDADMKFVVETANAIRDKGVRSQELVERFGEMSRNIREGCIDIKRRLDVP
jgi:hypothetical protein